MIFRYVSLSVGLGLAISFAATAQQSAAPVYNPTNPQPAAVGEAPSTSVGSDDRVTFRIHAPEAATVTLNGDFLLGAPLKPDSYTYNFTVGPIRVMAKI